jgi:hypothetical protein
MLSTCDQHRRSPVTFCIAKKVASSADHFCWTWSWELNQNNVRGSIQMTAPRLPEIEGSALTPTMWCLQLQQLNVIRRVIVATTWLSNAVYSFRNALKAQGMRTIRLTSGHQSSYQPGNVSFHQWAVDKLPCPLNEYDRQSCAGWQ